MKILAISLLSIAMCASAYAEGQSDTERLIRRIGPPPKPVLQDKFYFDSFYEPSDILQGNKTGRWSEITNTFGYSHGNILGYASVSMYNRFDQNDYTAALGSYLTFKDSYAHLEAGFGWDVDYIYKIQTIAEYAHKLYKTLYWQLGYNYRAYKTDDSHVLYPGLIYYFGEHYMSADYGVNYIDGRDTAHFGTVKGNFEITKFLRLTAGVAFGERLYDIFGLDADEEFGYILFGGVIIKVYKDINIRVGGSYSQEDPKFIKRSLNFGVSAKF